MDFRVPKPPSLPDDPAKLEILVLEPLWNALERARGSQEKKLAIFTDLTRGQKTVYYAGMLNGFVCNDGFSSVYYSFLGDVAPQVLAALRDLGSPEHLALFEQAIALCPASQLPADEEVRTALLDGLGHSGEQRLGEIDQAWYALDRAGRSFARVAAEYITAHPEDFFR